MPRQDPTHEEKHIWETAIRKKLDQLPQDMKLHHALKSQPAIANEETNFGSASLLLHTNEPNQCVKYRFFSSNSLRHLKMGR